MRGWRWGEGRVKMWQIVGKAPERGEGGWQRRGEGRCGRVGAKGRGGGRGRRGLRAKREKEGKR
ncbi:uncharacterized protein SCHCODRAFT_02179635 [Schizophyllum commune H4-8]|uniref:uncharacterized protein n=1 Tax=Schizophyllum commune (strain H4-8 / FGSC 9210) TaxID=578458 RepID=UPI00215F96B9|nr:uncharacterized protein SCHCODRAFT_02179635 [Schizophyllum commune H4-8]KAI5836590.1 hypothetical protein SCHCODRAFT_02179635 [Schizophyllum commune H4-8]